LFGLVSYITELRNKELAVRLACGAQPREIVWRVGIAILIPVGGGLLVGLAAAWLMQELIEAFMFGWTSSRLYASGLVISTTLLVAASAIVRPVLRVLQMDLSLVLKES
jgi:ABC-type antimicrobial peptide transport system permease subunit